MLPTLVSFKNNIDFIATPRLGLASLMLQSGYTKAEDFCVSLGEMIDTRSTIALTDTLIYAMPYGIATCIAGFSTAAKLKGLEAMSIMYQGITPRYTKAFPYLRSLVAGASAESSAALLEYFDYPPYSHRSVISDPISLLTWIAAAEPYIAPVVNALKEGDLYKFVSLVLKLHTDVDLNEHSRLRLTYKRWVQLAYVRYVMGSSISQSHWFMERAA